MAALELGDDVRAALEDTGIVILGKPRRNTEQVTLADGSVHRATTVDSERSLGDFWETLISAERADDLGLEVRPAALVYRNTEPLTKDQRNELLDLQEDLVYDNPNLTSSLDLSARWSESGPTPFQVELILAGIAFLFALVGCGHQLGAGRSGVPRRARNVLTVAGAFPGILARSAGAKAWLLAGIGALMAVPVGMLPVAVFVAADDGELNFVVPYRTIALLALAVPTLVALVALTTSAVAQRLRPVRDRRLFPYDVPRDG